MMAVKLFIAFSMLYFLIVFVRGLIGDDISKVPPPIAWTIVALYFASVFGILISGLYIAYTL